MCTKVYILSSTERTKASGHFQNYSQPLSGNNLSEVKQTVVAKVILSCQGLSSRVCPCPSAGHHLGQVDSYLILFCFILTIGLAETSGVSLQKFQTLQGKETYKDWKKDFLNIKAIHFQVASVQIPHFPGSQRTETY